MEGGRDRGRGRDCQGGGGRGGGKGEEGARMKMIGESDKTRHEFG